MVKRHLQITEDQVIGLQRAEPDSRSAPGLRRLQTVRLSGTRVAASTIQNAVGTSEHTVRRWVRRNSNRVGWGQYAN
jgi:transposase